MAFYQEIEPAPFEAFKVTEESPDFHGKTLVLLDNGSIAEIDTGTVHAGDYSSTALGFVPQAVFEAKYKEVSAPISSVPAPLS